MQFLIQGDRGIWVEYLQLALTRAGYPTKIDGIFGEHTCQALKDFTGNTDVCTVNRAVWEQLKSYLTGYRMHTIEREIRSLDCRADMGQRRRQSLWQIR